MRENERYLRLIAAVMFLAFGAYAAAFILEKSDDGTVTETAHLKSISESFSVSGKAYREFTPINADGSDYVILSAEGEHLSGGSAVAVTEENADEYFAYCDYLLSKKSFDSEQEAVNAIKNGNAAVRAQAVMYLEGQEAPEKALCPKDVIYAPCAGIFTESGGSIGAIASDVNWYFSFDSEKAKHLHRGQKLNLKISSGPEVSAEVYSIDEEKTVLIVRSCEDFIPRKESYDAEISVSECTGIKVPRKAMRFDENGSPFVYVISVGIKEKTAVEIIYTSRDFYLCNDNSLREGMEIIISEN